MLIRILTVNLNVALAHVNILHPSLNNEDL